MPQPPEVAPVPRSRAALLERIAETLGVPVEAFRDRSDGWSPTQGQASDILTAFAAIEDPALRRKCLMFVRAAGDTFPGGGDGS